jgi:hypothetical protein
MTTSDGTSRTACGPRTELAKNDGVRITRCSCGTIHLHIARSGVTLQLTEEGFAELARASNEALRDVESAGDSDAGPPQSRCIN